MLLPNIEGPKLDLEFIPFILEIALAMLVVGADGGTCSTVKSQQAPHKQSARSFEPSEG